MSVTKNNQGQTNDTMRLQDLIALSISRWKWFVLSVVCCLGLGVLYLLKTPPEYTRTAAILIKEDSKGSSSFSSEVNSFADMGLFASNTNVNNELASIQSPAIIQEVVRRLRLDMNYSEDGALYDKTLYGSTLPVTASAVGLADNDFWSFTLRLGAGGRVELSGFVLNGEETDGSGDYPGALGDTIATPIGRFTVLPTSYYAEGAEMDLHVAHSGMVASVDNCLANLTANLSSDKTTIINLTYKDVSIRRAEDFLNTLISIYNENWVRDKNLVAVSTSHFISERLEVIERELGEVDSDISSYKSENLIPDIQAASNMYMAQANEAGTQILNLNNQLYMARYVRNFVTNETGKNQLLPANTGINSPVIEQQIAEYNDKLLQRNSLVANSSTNNPMVIDMDNALASMRSAIVSSIDNQINALDTQIRGFRTSERQSTDHIASNPAQARYLLSVERQQKVKEALYLFLLQKREENELSQAFTAYNTRIVTPPTGKMTPTSPVKRNIMIVALLAGLLIPLIVIIVMENLNTKVRGREDLEALTVPFLGEIPVSGDKKGKRRSKKATEEDRYKILVKAKSRNMINEAFRVIRTNIEFMMEQDGSSKVIMVSSANPGSGKTFISMNLAAGFSVNDKKTVVVDLDMRKASLSNYVGSPAQGISNYLSGRVEDWKSIVVKNAKYPNMDVIPVGTVPPNPAELLFKPNVARLFETLRKEYDVVIVDCPPVELVADASIISKWVDMTVFVIRSGLMERDMLPVVESYYADNKLRNMSLLLNGTVVYGRYGYRRYGYHYGYGYGEYSHED